MLLRIPNLESKIFVTDFMENEQSIWSIKGLESYILEHFPEVKELSSIKTKKQIKRLAKVKFLSPDTVIATEGELCNHIHLVVGGKIDVFRKFKEDIEKNQQN